MHGYIHQALESMVIENHGTDVYVQAKANAKCGHVPVGGWPSLQKYDDELTVKLVKCICTILGEEIPTFLEAFGGYFIELYVRRGYSDLLACNGGTLRVFLENVNEMHAHLKATICDSFVFPCIHCADDPENEEGCFLLLYRSPRGTLLAPLFVGVVKAAARVQFEHSVEMQLLWEQGDRNKYTTWRVRNTGPVVSQEVPVETSLASHSDTRLECETAATHAATSPRQTDETKQTHASSRCPFTNIELVSPAKEQQVDQESTSYHNFGGLSYELLDKAFPYHIKFSNNFVVTGIGRKLFELLEKPLSSSQDIRDWFTIEFPGYCAWTWPDLLRNSSKSFEIATTSSIEAPRLPFNLVGGIYPEHSDHSAVLLVQPNITSLKDMVHFGLNWGSSIPNHSFQRR